MRAEPSVKRIVTTETTTTTKYSADDLIEALGLPDGAEITVRVPGGGDWSNTDLNLKFDATLDVVVKTRTREETV